MLLNNSHLVPLIKIVKMVRKNIPLFRKYMVLILKMIIPNVLLLIYASYLPPSCLRYLVVKYFNTQHPLIEIYIVYIIADIQYIAKAIKQIIPSISKSKNAAIINSDVKVIAEI